MKISISSYLTLFLLAVSTVLSGSFVAMHLQTTNAREYNAAVIERIQASHFSPSVISDVVSESASNGYETTVTDVGLYEDQPEMLVSTHYEVGFPAFGIVKEGVVEGYAR